LFNVKGMTSTGVSIYDLDEWIEDAFKLVMKILNGGVDQQSAREFVNKRRVSSRLEELSFQFTNL
jgi:hypothetical protein